MSDLWTPSSLFLCTEFLFWRAHSVLHDVGDAIVITTPTNPFYRWGHVIVLKAPPKSEDRPRWRELHAKHIAPLQAVPNRILVWDGPAVDKETEAAYANDGLKYSSFDVLTLRALARPEFYNSQIEIRLLDGTSREWEHITECNVESFGVKEDDTYREYMMRRMAHYREMVATGRGTWYAAFLEGDFAGSLGIFCGDGLYRFQQIAVRPNFRRRGVAGRLVHEAATRALQEFPDYPQVIAASRTGDAFRIYRALGFETDSVSHALGERA